MGALLGPFAFGSVLALLGIVGLVLAANALDLMMAIFGQGLFLFAVAFNFGLLKRHFDAAERDGE